MAGASDRNVTDLLQILDTIEQLLSDRRIPTDVRAALVKSIAKLKRLTGDSIIRSDVMANALLEFSSIIERKQNYLPGGIVTATSDLRRIAEFYQREAAVSIHPPIAGTSNAMPGGHSIAQPSTSAGKNSVARSTIPGTKTRADVERERMEVEKAALRIGTNDMVTDIRKLTNSSNYPESIKTTVDALINPLRKIIAVDDTQVRPFVANFHEALANGEDAKTIRLRLSELRTAVRRSSQDMGIQIPSDFGA